MKKSLLALAVLGAFTGIAYAQTNVTLYGIVDESIGRYDNGQNSTMKLDSGRNAASRWGIKGTEDLGNGLKASFVLEQGFNADDGSAATSTAAFSRIAYVGLGGGFGEFRMGRQNSPMKTAQDVIDPFGGGGIASAVSLLGVSASRSAVVGAGLGGAVAATAGTPERVSNQVTYISPNFSGFQGSAAYNFGETEGDTSANRGYAVQLGFVNGPIAVQAAYGEQNTTSPAVVGPPAVAPVDSDAKHALIGATYNFGVAKLHAGWKQTKNESNLGAAEAKVNGYLLGVTVPFGASTIRASYIDNRVKDADALDSKAYALSYSYSLSKRTTLYTTYLTARNERTARLSGGIAPAAVGEDPSAFVVGVQHNF